MSWENRHVNTIVAIPHSGGEVYFDWAINLAQIMKEAPPNTFELSAPEPQIDTAREKLCEIALSNGAKQIFFLDADTIPPKDVIKRLMRHKLPIVSGLYARRHYPCHNLMMLKAVDDKGNEGFTPIPEGGYAKGELIRCDAVGFGCILIQTDVLKDLEKPWFSWTEHKSIRGMSEDFWFCERARRAGYKIFCDTSVVCRHMGPIKILPSVGAQGLYEHKTPSMLNEM